MTELLDVFVDARNGATVVSVRGEVDLSSAPRLANDLHAAVGSTMLLVVDLSAVSYLDSAGLAVLHASAQRTSSLGVSLRIVVGEDSVVYRALDISGVLGMIPTYSSIEAAWDGAASQPEVQQPK
jgi:anti-anti-sigma factor